MSPAASRRIAPFLARAPRHLFWLSCAGLLLALHAPRQHNSDEGIVLNGAWNLLNGRAPYTDYFEFVAPGSFYLIFGVWKLLGAHFWAAKLAGILAITGAVVGIYRTARLIVPHGQPVAPGWILFGPLIFCLMSGYWPAINHNTLNIALVVWSAYFVTKSILFRSLLNACVAGLIAGLAVVVLQHRGLVLVATVPLVLGFFYRRDKDAAWLKSCAGFVAGALIPVGTLFLFWPASVLIENLIRFPTSHYLGINQVDPSPFLISASFLVLGTWLLRNSSSRAVGFLFALQWALLLTALQRPDLSHVTIALSPFLSLFPLLATAAKISMLPIFSLFWIVAGPLALILPLVSYQVASNPVWRFWDGSMEHDPMDYIKANCSSSPFIYAGPFPSGIYFETRKLNATRHSVLLTGFNTAAHFAQAKEDLEVNRPQCVITNYEMASKFNYTRDNVVDRYIAANYQLAYQAGPVQVLVRKS